MKKLTGRTFDIVFTDLAMPEMDGWETAREIRKQCGDELRIVLVTGYGPAAVSPQGEDNLIDGVIGKPFDFTQVMESIADVVGKQAILEEVTA
jgi:CheY-like chemotaxis protein